MVQNSSSILHTMLKLLCRDILLTSYFISEVFTKNYWTAALWSVEN